MNAAHVDNLDTITKLEKSGFDGVDASLDIALFEYGLAWHDLGNGDWLFIYGIGADEIDGQMTYTRFDRCEMRESEFTSDHDWCDFDAVCKPSGIEVETWQAWSFAQRIADLVSYYGTEEIFGSCYWSGFAIAE